MNTFLHDNLIAILVFILLSLLALMGFMIFIFYKLLLNKNQRSFEHSDAEKIAYENLKANFKKHSKKAVFEEKFYCSNHQETQSVGSCLICENVYCEKCLVDHEGLSFCKEHFKTFANNRWVQITDTKTTPDSPEEGLYIYETKRELWENKGIPTFIVTHYKINIENDFIESFIQLNVREEDSHQLKIDLENKKARH